MKTIAAILTAILCFAGLAHGGDIDPTNYFAGYVVVSATHTNSGDTGLTVSNAYISIPLTLFSGVTEATATNDVRAVVDGFLNHLYASYTANTNKPTYMTVTRGATAVIESTNLWLEIDWRTNVRKGTSDTFPSE